MALPLRKKSKQELLEEQFNTAPLFVAQDLRPMFPTKSGIRQINSPTGRMYQIPTTDGTRFVTYPSMSRVTGDMSKDAIVEWRNHVGSEEANRVSRTAANRGTNLHALCETYITNDLDKFYATWSKSMPNVTSLWSAIKKWLIENVDEIWAIEHKMYSHELRVAGTVDFIGVINGVPSVLDFKTSLKLKKREWIDAYFMQASGYAQMFKEIHHAQLENIVIVIGVDTQPNDPQVFIEPVTPSYKLLCQQRLEFYKKYKL